LPTSNGAIDSPVAGSRRTAQVTRDWQLFWSNESDPHHPKTRDFLLLHGREFALAGVNPNGKRVLEIGCGSGSLFQAVGFDQAGTYRGVDFSEKMLATFRAAHPGVALSCADASSYIDDSKYDLIFSNQVAQYFSRGMLKRHIVNACAMLAPGGTIVIGSVPWSGARAAFHLQAFGPANERRLMRGLAVLARSYVGIDRMGRWYTYGEFTRLAQRHHLRATYFGCLQFPYRFHVRMDDASQI
jgi:cyclopropane fatty-acyl-phospholipid synthase-like methyltransferase